MRSYMIKFSAGIVYEQNRPTGVASALIAQFGVLAKSDLKMHCTKFFSDKNCCKLKYTTFVAKFFLIARWFGLCPDWAIRFFGKVS